MATFESKFESLSIWLNSQPIYHRFLDRPLQQRYGIVGSALFLLLIITTVSLYMLNGEYAVYGFLASILTGLATGIGALPAIFVKHVSPRLFNGMLGLSAGVMLAATAFALIIPGIEFGNEVWPGHGLWIVSLGMLFGGGFLHLTDNRLPHLHIKTNSEYDLDSIKKVSLFIFAVTIHNFPEGISVGVVFGAGNLDNHGTIMAMAIGLQNLPEGLAVALPLIALGYNKWKAVLVATLTGLMEPIGGIMGATMVALFGQVLPVAMGFAGGAMLFVISEEIIPQTHNNGTSRTATFSLMVGFIIMMVMEHLLG